MYLGGKLRSPVEELVRLTMLALLTTMFRIPGRKVRYQWVARQMKSVYAQLGDEVLTLDSSLNLWILMFAAGTVANTKEKWVADAWAWASYGLNWPAVKYNLMRIMWFEVIHDEPGEKVCHSFEDGLGDYNVFQDSRNRQ